MFVQVMMKLCIPFEQCVRIEGVLTTYFIFTILTFIIIIIIIIIFLQMRLWYLHNLCRYYIRSIFFDYIQLLP